VIKIETTVNQTESNLSSAALHRVWQVHGTLLQFLQRTIAV